MGLIINPNDPNEGHINPSGSEIERSRQMASEVLSKLNMTLTKPAETENEKTMKRMTIANRAAVFTIHTYHEKHPLATNFPELEKQVLHAYAREFATFSKEDLIQLLSMQQAIGCLKQFGYLQ